MTYTKEAREKPGVLPDDPMSEAGRKVLGYHFARMLKEEPAIREEQNPDAVHDMRVATRRMRSALDLFEPFYSEREIRPLRRKLRRLARALGAARDLDVLHHRLNEHLENNVNEIEGMVQVSGTLQEERQVARADLLALLRTSQYGDLVDDMRHFVETPRLGALTPDNADGPQPYRVREVAPRLIYTQYGVVRAYEPLLAHLSLDGLHALRIEAKRLRYTLEAFAEVLGEQSKAAINAAKNLQDYLGELQDARVEVEKLEAYSDDENATEAVKQYIALRRAEKKRLRAGVPEAWAAYIAPEVRQAVALAVAVL